MCWATTCNKCGKTTWAGCGRHAEQVMSKVPEENRCVCGKTELKEGKTEDEVAAENKQDIVAGPPA